MISGSQANYSSLVTGRHSKFDAPDSHHQPPTSSQDAYYYGGMTSGALDSLVSRTRSSTHRKGKSIYRYVVVRIEAIEYEKDWAINIDCYRERGRIYHEERRK